MKKIIAIERQYASGGKLIAERAAELLGIKSHSDDILEAAAERLGTTSDKLRHIEEDATNSLLYSLAYAVRTSDTLHDSMSPEQRLFLTESEIIKEIAENESCIFVGRCAASILREREDCLRVFIYADEDFRKNLATTHYGIAEDKVAGVLKKQDRRRGNFYNMNSDIKWDERSAYDLLINSSSLGLENAAAMLSETYKVLSSK